MRIGLRRDARAVREFGLMAEALGAQLPDRAVASGYLEFAKPTITESLESLTARGARGIWALPGMLFAAMHMKTDIPAELDAFGRKHPEVTLRFGAELGLDWRMLEAARWRARRPCWWWWDAAPAIPMPTATSPRSPACCGT